MCFLRVFFTTILRTIYTPVNAAISVVELRQCSALHFTVTGLWLAVPRKKIQDFELEKLKPLILRGGFL